MTQKVSDLARIDTGLGIPSGEKASFVTEISAEHMDMPVTEFSRNVVGMQVSESYIRDVLREQNPSAWGVDIDDVIFE